MKREFKAAFQILHSFKKLIRLLSVVRSTRSELSASHYSPEMAAVAQAGLANLQKGEKTMTHVLPATPSLPL